MKAQRKRRLIIIAGVIAGVSLAVSLLFVALGSNMNHYYELKAIAAGKAPLGKKIRIGGMVKKGSIKRQPGSLKLRFVITDFQRNISVSYEGILPDLFREGQGVLVKGKLHDNKNFIAQEILAKHDENYMPKEVKEELESMGHGKKDQQPAN